MNKPFLISCFLFSLLHPLCADERKDIFIEKSFHDAKTVEEAKAIKKIVRDQSPGINTFVKDANLSSFDLLPETFAHTDPENTADGQAIGDHARSKKFTGSVKNMENHILHDKRLNWSKALDVKTEIGEDPFVKKGSLGSDERLFVVVSSSMPDTLVKTYLQRFEPIAEDTVFVMRGAIGGAKKILPTLNWVQKMKTYADGQYYRCQIDINPNISRRYKIDRVPAIIFVTGYDENAMTNTGIDAISPVKEKVYIAYGAIDPEAALQEIQKQASNKSLAGLIDKIGGW